MSSSPSPVKSASVMSCAPFWTPYRTCCGVDRPIAVAVVHADVVAHDVAHHQIDGAGLVDVAGVDRPFAQIRADVLARIGGDRPEGAVALVQQHGRGLVPEVRDVVTAVVRRREVQVAVRVKVRGHVLERPWPTVYLVNDPNWPPPVPGTTEIDRLDPYTPLCVVTRSGRPSRFRSRAMVIPGNSATGTSRQLPNVPSPRFG